MQPLLRSLLPLVVFCLLSTPLAASRPASAQVAGQQTAAESVSPAAA